MLWVKFCILEIEIFIEIGGIVEVSKNIGKHGIYLCIFGLFDMYITQCFN
jgi:hypothetical protein